METNRQNSPPLCVNSIERSMGKGRSPVENVRGDAAWLGMLRRYEGYCYQAAYYLLNNERDALAASCSALLELAGDAELMKLSEPEQLQKVKRTVSIHSLHIRKNAVLAG
jgi:hypothetical protein